MTQHDEARSFWEERYAGADRVWSGRVNATTAAIMRGLSPGRVLDLGCGEGGDALWLAEAGWSVRAVDISATAVARATARARARGLDARFEEADLSDFDPGEEFDVVVSSFLHSPVDFDRDAVLARATAWVRAGGRLVVVGHATPPPWSRALHEHRHDLVTASEQVRRLALGDGWTVERMDTVRREATGPDGEMGTLEDAVVVALRADRSVSA